MPTLAPGLLRRSGGRHDPDRARPIVGEPPRWFADEHDNLRLALAAALDDDPGQALLLAASTWRFWMSRGLIEEGVRWLRRALDAHPDRSAVRSAALYGLAVLHTRLGEAEPLAGIGVELVAIAADARGPRGDRRSPSPADGADVHVRRLVARR